MKKHLTVALLLLATSAFAKIPQEDNEEATATKTLPSEQLCQEEVEAKKVKKEKQLDEMQQELDRLNNQT